MSEAFTLAVMQDLLLNLRRRLPADSPLVTVIHDSSLLLKLTASQAPCFPNELFDIKKLADAALLSAKFLHPLGVNRMLSLSFERGCAAKWLGPAELIETLIRCLLLISLERTPQGFISLRLQHRVIDHADYLFFALEDNGKSFSSAHVHEWLEYTPAHANIPPPSWMLACQLFKHLHGSIVSCAVEQGLHLSGRIPLTPHYEESALHYTPLQHTKTTMPVVLMVEDDTVNRMMQMHLFEQAGYSVCAVASGEEALEWANTLPYSLIVLDMQLPDIQGPVLARRLQKRMQERLIPPCPIIALTASDTSEDIALWQENEVEIIWRKPLASSMVSSLRPLLADSLPGFYWVRDTFLDDDLLAGFAEHLPEMKKLLEDQIAILIEKLSEPQLNMKDISHTAHGIKSATLSLGYFRLSAFMSALEHAANAARHIFLNEHRLLFLHCLQQALK